MAHGREGIDWQQGTNGWSHLHLYTGSIKGEQEAE